MTIHLLIFLIFTSSLSTPKGISFRFKIYKRRVAKSFRSFIIILCLRPMSKHVVKVISNVADKKVAGIEFVVRTK